MTDRPALLPVTRRDLLRGGLYSAAAIGAGMSLQACATAAQTPSGAEQNAANQKVRLPTFTPYQGSEPDLPATEDGGLPGFLTYPVNPKRELAEPPGDGGAMEQLVPITSGLPPALAQNRYWQELNARLGLELKLQMVPDGDGYASKLTTILAGGDIPDALCISAPSTRPNMSQIATHVLQNLDEFLSGDAVKDYPFLANLPTPSWASTVFNGSIYGVPVPRGEFGSITFQRKDFLSRKSLTTAPESFEEFRQVCQDVTDPRSNLWAVDRPAAALQLVINMLGKPNRWTEQGGEFTSQYESEEMRRALSAVRDLMTDGSVHPDGVAATPIKAKQFFRTGTVVFFTGGYKGWLLDIFSDWPDQAELVDGLVEPGFEGGKGSHPQGAPLFSMTSLKKTDEARIRQLLGICNWMAAPFGTEEYLFRKFGLAEVDHVLEGTDPVATERGTQELLLPAYYVADAPDVVYAAGQPDNIKVIHAYLAKEAPLITPDPTLGLYSATNSTKGVTLTKQVADFQNEFFQGRKTLNEWDAMIKTWKADGGDAIRQEYAEAHAAING
jgi:putative aldouronate transport system substrate-binding protein